MNDKRVAAVCMHAAVGRVEENLQKVEYFASKAAAMGAEMVCFPELSISGYTLKHPSGLSLQSEPGTAPWRLVRAARDAQLVIMAGLMEASTSGKPYITHLVAGPDGIVGRYRKTHLSPMEAEFYGWGSKIEIFSHGGACFGIQLCYETHFPEISTVMALMGADILFFPHASPIGDPGSKLKSWLRHLPGRAFDNGVFVVACNQVGETDEGLSFPGAAVILGPDGQILSKYMGDHEGVLFGTLKGGTLEEVRRHKMKYFLPRRNPALYGKIMEPPGAA